MPVEVNETMIPLKLDSSFWKTVDNSHNCQHSQTLSGGLLELKNEWIGSHEKGQCFVKQKQTQEYLQHYRSGDDSVEHGRPYRADWMWSDSSVCTTSCCCDTVQTAERQAGPQRLTIRSWQPLSAPCMATIYTSPDSVLAHALNDCGMMGNGVLNEL